MVVTGLVSCTCLWWRYGEAKNLAEVTVHSTGSHCRSGIILPEPTIVVVDSDQRSAGVGFVTIIIRSWNIQAGISALISVAWGCEGAGWLWLISG